MILIVVVVLLSLVIGAVILFAGKKDISGSGIDTSGTTHGTTTFGVLDEKMERSEIIG